jgi:uncharacterized protein (DUF2237 family)
MMNCEEYRQAIAADPSFDGGAAHLSECAACKDYRKQILELDKAISAALSLDVPKLEMPELPDVDTGNVVSLPARRWNAPTLIAIAATVILAAFIGVRMFGSAGEYDTLAEQLLAHIDHEPGALQVSNVPVSDVRLAAVVPADVARLDHSTGLITYARSCEINGRDVPHLVIQGERGPVTLLLMPHETIDGPQSITGESVSGVILPVGDGSIAIFGERDEPLERIEKKVLDSVTWST